VCSHWLGGGRFAREVGMEGWTGAMGWYRVRAMQCGCAGGVHCAGRVGLTVTGHGPCVGKCGILQASKRYVPNSSSVPLHALIVVLYNPLFFKLTERELRVYTYLGVVVFAL
jgi:hypothetical protein